MKGKLEGIHFKSLANSFCYLWNIWVYDKLHFAANILMSLVIPTKEESY